jgi:ubiquinone/menaquinone biosynthesis C-methylase UbiE
VSAASSFVDLLSPSGASSLRVRAQCPACTQIIGAVQDDGSMPCSRCGFTISLVDGIYRALTPERREYFSKFISDYEKVREKEGRGSASAEYYLALPFQDLSGRNQWQWSIRARTFKYLQRRILPQIEAKRSDADILDIGAGNCWLSYRLAARGHHPVAVDLIDNDADGLGAARHYLAHLQRAFPRFTAEMDRLPFASNQFDAVFFNASLHYSTNYLTTLSEAMRCLKRPGYVVVMDSPFYRQQHSGEQMVKEKQSDFQRRFGFASDSIASEEFLTRDKLSEISRQLGLKFEIKKPWYGYQWFLRPVKARLRGKREPAKFYFLWAMIEK